MAVAPTGDPVATDVVKRHRRGWYAYGWAAHTFPTIVTTVFMGRYLTSVAEKAVGEHGRVHLLGIPIAPGSLFVYTVSFVTVLLVVAMPVVGAIADRTGAKREILLGFGWLGAACCIAMVGVTGSSWQLGALLYAVAYFGYSCATVVNYSLLIAVSDVDERDRVSSMGWAISYVGGGLLLAVSLGLSFVLDRATLARISLCGAGLWWAAFNIVPWRMLRGLPKPTVAEVSETGSVLTAGFRQLARTLRHLRNYPYTLAFLIAFLVYNDGIQTVTTVAAQYADKELGLDDNVLLPAILIVQFVAFGGAIWCGRLADQFGAKRVVMATLATWLALVGIAYLLQRGVIWQFWAYSVAIAIVLGGSQALSRSIFSRMIPTGNEAAYFGFYEVSDSGTSWLGPLIFGIALQLTNSYRNALASLAVFFAVGLLLLARVPVRQGVIDAGHVPPAKL